MEEQNQPMDFPIENRQFQRYKGKFKLLSLINIIKSATIFIAMLLAFFLPIFHIGGENNSMDFSFFSELCLTFKGSLYAMEIEIFALILMVAGMIMALVDCGLSIARFVKVDSYCVNEYDRIKSRQKPTRWAYMISPQYWFFVGLGFEILAAVLCKVLSNYAGTLFDSYFMLMTGVSGIIALLIIFVVAAIALSITASVIKSGVKTSILKEDYNILS